MRSAAKPLFQGESGSGGLASSADQILVNQVDGPSLRAAGVRLVLGAVWPPFRLRPGRSARGEALNQLEELSRFTRRHPDFALAGSSQEARSALSRGRIAVLPSVEGGEGIGAVEDVDLYFAAGARSLTLVHFTGNALAGAAHGQIRRAFGLSTNGRSEDGLTPLGRAAVQRMIQLGMLIDLAHASDRTSLDVLQLTEVAGVPVMNSHAGARALTPMERNLPDELAGRIARGGGVLGVTSFRAFLANVPEAARLPDHQPGSCDDLVAHWLHLARVAGPEAITLGSDFNGTVARPRPGGSCPAGLRNSEDLPGLFAAIEAHGVPRSALDAMGERVLRALEAVETRADPAARAAARARRPPQEDPFDVPI